MANCVSAGGITPRRSR